MERISRLYALLRRLAIGMITGALTLAWFGVTPRLTSNSPDFGQDWDHHQYIAMARGENAAAPYAYRILTPLLASLLPFSLETNFTLITFLALWGTGIAVYYLARAFDFSPPLALIDSAMFYTLYWAVGFNFYDFWLCDPLLFLFIVLAIRAARLKQARTFAVLLAVGVLNKETMLCVAPLWFVFNPTR